MATNSFQVGPAPRESTLETEPHKVDVCPIMVAALAAASSIAFLNGDADVVDFVQQFTPDMRKVVLLIVSTLTLSTNDSAKPVIGKLYEAEVKWRQGRGPNIGE